MKIDSEFFITSRVYYEDTDAGGVVYYANYLKYFERARTEWLRHVGINQSELAQHDQIIFVVKAVEIQYRKPAVLDDILTVHNTVSRIGRASITFNQEVRKDNITLCDGKVTVCAVNTNTFKPTPIPNKLRKLFEQAGS